MKLNKNMKMVLYYFSDLNDALDGLIIL